MKDGHWLTVNFDGDTEYLTLSCTHSGADRPCALITCPVDHEDVSRECIEEHGAVAKDACWAVEWFEAGGRESLNTEAIGPVSIPVSVDYDDGVVVS